VLFVCSCGLSTQHLCYGLLKSVCLLPHIMLLPPLQAACLAKCNGANVTLHRSGTFTLEEFRRDIIETCRSGEEHLVVSGGHALSRHRLSHFPVVASNWFPWTAVAHYFGGYRIGCPVRTAMLALQPAKNLGCQRNSQLLLTAAICFVLCCFMPCCVVCRSATLAKPLARLGMVTSAQLVATTPPETLC